MNPRDAAKLMFVGMGVLCLVWAVGMIQGAFFMYDSQEELLSRIVNRVAGFLPLVCFFYLAVHFIRNRERYSQHLFPEPTASSRGMSPDDLHTVGLSLIGVYVIAIAIPKVIRYAAWAMINLVQSIASKSVVTGQLGTPTTRYPLMIEEIIAAVISLAVGVALVWFSPNITALLLHRIERKPAPEPVETACPYCGHPYSLSDYRSDAEAIFCSKCGNQLTGAQEPERE